VAYRRKSVLNEPDRGTFLILWPNDFNDIEPTGVFQQPVGLEKCEGGASESCLPVGVYRFSGTAMIWAATSFHLDEDNRLIIDCQDINFAVRQSVSSEENLVAESTQISCSVLFASLAE